MNRMLIVGLAFVLLIGLAKAQSTTYWSYGGVWSAPHYSAVSTTIGGTLLVAGGCITPKPTVTVTGIVPGQGVIVTPVTDPGNISAPWGMVLTNDTVTLNICALVAMTPASTTYVVKILSQ